MKFLRHYLLPVTLGLALLRPVCAEPAPVLRGEYVIPNIGSVKLQLRDYYRSGQYKEEVRLVAAKAKEYLLTRLSSPVSGRPAICLDIDETSLSNYSHIEEMDFAFLSRAWTAWVEQGSAPALEPVLDLYQTARAKGVYVLFIPGRPPTQKTATENNLRTAGYTEWAELVFKDSGSQQSSEAFKASQRKRLTEAGYHILVNLGDQDSDLAGGYAESAFKLPNPMYLVP